MNQTTFGSTEQGVHEDLESDEQVGYSQILHDIAEKDLEMPIQSTFTDQIHSPSSSSGHTESSSSCSCSSCSCDENCPPDCKGEFVCCFKGSCNLDVVPLENCKNGLICCDKKSCQSQVVEVTECPNQMESNRKSIDVGSAPIKSSNDDNEGDVHFANQSTQTLQCSKDGPCHEESIFDVENDEKQAFDFKRRRSVGFQIPRFNSTGNLLQPSLYEKDSYYTGKDLSAYLGMKDQVSKSIQFHEVNSVAKNSSRHCFLHLKQLCLSVTPNLSYDNIILLFSQLFADEREMYRSSVKSAITRTRSSFKKLKRKLSFKSYGSRREIFNPPSKTKSPYLKRGPAVRRPAKKHPSLTRNPTTYF